jgi:hypothetical protein
MNLTGTQDCRTDSRKWLRPHLQRRRAQFRYRSSNTAPARAPALLPPEAQQRFPGWEPFRDDLFATNQRLISYVGALETKIARPNSPQTKRTAGKRKGTATEKQGSASGKQSSQST